MYFLAIFRPMFYSRAARRPRKLFFPVPSDRGRAGPLFRALSDPRPRAGDLFSARVSRHPGLFFAGGENLFFMYFFTIFGFLGSLGLSQVLYIIKQVPKTRFLSQDNGNMSPLGTDRP